MNDRTAEKHELLSENELRERNNALRLLFQEWLADESGYDEATWPVVKRLIEENALSSRSPFCD